MKVILNKVVSNSVMALISERLTKVTFKRCFRSKIIHNHYSKHQIEKYQLIR